MAESQNDHNPVLVDFRHWYSNTLVAGSGGVDLRLDRQFIPYTEIQGYSEDSRRMQRLLNALYPDTAPPIDTGDIQQKHSRVFFILILIGMGRYIQHFVRYNNLSDHHLPFDYRPPSFPPTSSGIDFFASFCRQQWAFCAPVFTYNMHQRFGIQEILPFTDVEELASGGSPTTYRVIIHEAYNRLSTEANAHEVSIVTPSFTWT